MTPATFRRDIADWVLAMPVAAALGFDFEELGDGRSVTRLRWRVEHSHVPGSFQASPIAALADFTGASAVISVLPAGSTAATLDMTVKYLAAASGDELVARAKVLRPGRTVTVAGVDVNVATGERETLCATALVSVRSTQPLPAHHQR